MPLKIDTTDILAYAEASWWTPKEIGAPQALAYVFADLLERQEESLERWPVRNREERSCWPCNENKSNYERDQRKRLGVVVACWYCEDRSRGDLEELPMPVNEPVYCGRCGCVSRVPEIEGWVL